MALAIKNPSANAGDIRDEGSIPGLERSPEKKKKKKDPLDEGTTTHSNILAWRIAWTREPGRL